MADHEMQASPLDRTAVTLLDRTTPIPAACSWKPSQFNVQSTTDDGWLLLWNSYSGSVNSFKPHQRDGVLDLLSPQGTRGPDTGIRRYLEERGYLVRDNVEEIRRVQYDFGSKQHRTDRLELILLASEDCNFRCNYCYEDFEKGTMLPEVREGVKNLALSRIANLESMSVWWFGGEPLYGMAAIDDIAPFLVDLCEREGVAYSSHMTTNGYLLTPDVMDRMLDYKVTDFQITVDGMQEDHDRNRPGRSGQGTYEVILDNLRAIAARPERDFIVAIRVNFDKGNLPRMEEFLKTIQDDFRDDERFEIAFHAVGRWGGDNDAELDVCGTTESHDARLRLVKEARKLGLGVANAKGPGPGAGHNVCYAVRPYNLIVGATGRLMKCTIDLDKADHNVVGHINPDGTCEIDVDRMSLWTEPAFERDTGCQSCHVMAACQGVHCPKIRIDSGRRPCPPVRRTAKKQLVDYFEATTASRDALRSGSNT